MSGHRTRWLVVLMATGTLWSMACAPTQPAETPQGQPPSPSVRATSPVLGEGPSTPADAVPVKKVRPCDLLSPEEIASEVGPPFSEGIMGDSICHWPGEGGQLSAALSVVDSPDVAACLKGRSEGSQDVEGLGAEAWWAAVQAETTVGSLVVCPRGYQVTFTLSGGEDESSLRGAAEALAATVLDRL